MGEEVRMSEYEGRGGGGCGGDDERVSEWEIGLPNVDDLTPLSQLLIPPELASAFRITPEPYKSAGDVNRASQSTLSGLRGGGAQGSDGFDFKAFDGGDRGRGESVVAEEEEDGDEMDLNGSDSRKTRRIDGGAAEEAAENGEDPSSARTLKRPRLVWTPQLHKRFVDVVGHLGIKNAVPKTIMQLMNVEGLTRENVASHLQKYRLYLKRMQGLSNEGPSPSDHLFASTPVPQNLHESGGGGGGGGGGSVNGHSNVHHMPMPIPMPYPPQMMHMPVLGMGHGHMGMPQAGSGSFHGFESHPFNMMQQTQRDWSGNSFGYHHVPHNEK